MNCTAVDPNNAATLYAGAATGGLWKSTDNGLTWAALFTDQPTLGVSGIAIDPTNSSVIYCATGDGDGNDTYSMGVIKSTDGGASWTTTGLNWATTAARNTRMLRMSPADPQTLFCAANNGLWKTSDGGGVWAKVADGSFHDVEFKPDDPGVVYACGDQFYRSIDGGSTFTTTGAGLPAATLVNRMRIAVSAADPIKVYVLCGKEVDGGYLGLYRSTDGGSNFTLRSSSPNIFGYEEHGQRQRRAEQLRHGPAPQTRQHEQRVGRRHQRVEERERRCQLGRARPIGCSMDSPRICTPTSTAWTW